jgi:hypothetical protein
MRRPRQPTKQAASLIFFEYKPADGMNAATEKMNFGTSTGQLDGHATLKTDWTEGACPLLALGSRTGMSALTESLGG